MLSSRGSRRLLLSGFEKQNSIYLYRLAWFVVIFGINITSDISKLLYVNLRQFWNISSGIYAKYHLQMMLLFVYATTRKGFVIFTSTEVARYFKLSWNTSALSQSNCRNFSCSGIIWKKNLEIEGYFDNLPTAIPTKMISYSSWFSINDKQLGIYSKNTRPRSLIVKQQTTKAHKIIIINLTTTSETPL